MTEQEVIKAHKVAKRCAEEVPESIMAEVYQAVFSLMVSVALDAEGRTRVDVPGSRRPATTKTAFIDSLMRASRRLDEDSRQPPRTFGHE